MDIAYAIYARRFSLLFSLCIFMSCCTSDNPASSVSTSTIQDVSVNMANVLEGNTDEGDSCNAIVTPAPIVGVSLPSVDPGPIEKEFWTDTTVLLELFVYKKNEGCKSTLIETHQVDRSTLGEISDSKDIGDANPISVLNAMSSTASEYIVSLDSDPAVANVFHICPEGFDTINEFNYIARTTDESGVSVTLINGDSCGDIPDFQFADIDGQVVFERFSYLRGEIASAMN